MNGFVVFILLALGLAAAAVLFALELAVLSGAVVLGLFFS